MIINFNKSKFYPLKKNFNTKKIKLFKEVFIESKLPKDFVIKEVSDIQNLKNNSILFLDKKYKNMSLSLKNTIKKKLIHIITDLNIKDIDKISDSYTQVNNLKLSYNLIINSLFIHPDHHQYRDKFTKKNNSFISTDCNIHKSVKIGNNCTIGRGVIIGKNCIIKDNVIIKNSILEDSVIISENCVIGSSGFGFDLNSISISRLEPQIGIVYISKNSSIGASCTIDRAKINITFIGSSCMLDNQVHIAHNVILGNNVVIAGQSGVAGSSHLGDNVVMGGQSGVSGHLKIGNNVMIGAKSAVTKNINSNSIVAGYPAMDINKWKKMIIKQRNK